MNMWVGLGLGSRLGLGLVSTCSHTSPSSSPPFIPAVGVAMSSCHWTVRACVCARVYAVTHLTLAQPRRAFLPCVCRLHPAPRTSFLSRTVHCCHDVERGPTDSGARTCDSVILACHCGPLHELRCHVITMHCERLYEKWACGTQAVSYGTAWYACLQ